MRGRQSGLVFYERKRGFTRESLVELLSMLLYTVVVIVVAWLLVFAFGYRVRMTGSAMLPTIQNEQHVYLDRVIYQFQAPKRGDIVAFHPNGNENAHIMIRRVVALPGELVEIREGVLYIDGVAEEADRRYDLIADAGIAVGGVALGPKEYFVLGDLRGISEDSRSPGIGNVRADTIVGKAWFWTGRGAQ